MDLTITGKTRVVSPTAAVLYDGVNKLPDRYRWISLDTAEPNLGIPLSGVDIEQLKNGNFVSTSTETYILCTNTRGDRGWILYNASDQGFSSEERPDLSSVDSALEWLVYKDPTIVNFQLSASYFSSTNFYPGIKDSETTTIPILLKAGTVGTTSVTLSWLTNKYDERAIRKYYLKSADNNINDFVSQTLTGDYTFKTYTLNIDTSSPVTCAFALTAEDWAVKRGTGDLIIKALGPIYYGKTTVTNINDITNSIIQIGSDSLVTGSPQNTYGFSGLVDASRFFIAWPLALGYTPKQYSMNNSVLLITVGSNELITRNLTMDSGVVIPYQVFVTNEFYNSDPSTIRLIN